MQSFPKDLLDALFSGEAVAVVGSGLSVASGLPTWKELLELLIKECEQNIFQFQEGDELRELLKDGLFSEVADECSSRLGKSLYRDFIQRIFQSVTLKPNATHQLLYQLPFSAILTTNYDTLLEQVFVKNRDNGIPPVYTQKNIAQLARLTSDKKFFILKMHGHVDDVDTIILTHRDYQDIIHHPAYRTALSAYFTMKTLVFIGYGLRDPDLNLILNEQVSVFKGFGRRHFALVPNAGKILPKLFKDKYNITILPYESKNHYAELQALLLKLIKEVNTLKGRRHTSTTSETPVIHPCPYKFLDYYDVQDKDLFFGREEETVSILQSLLAHKLLILFGQSGVGKTSLLKAGVFPQLLDRDYTVIYCRLTDPKLESILVECDKLLSTSLDRLVAVPKEAANILLDKVRLSRKSFVLLLDQVEQMFKDFEQSSFDPICEFLKTIINHEMVQCHVLLSVREDYFVRLNDLTHIIPDVFNNRYHLTSLKSSSAEVAIRRPAQSVGLQCDDSFVHGVITDLDREGVEPTQLQIVCTAVFKALPVECKKIDIGVYKDLGGAEKLLSSYIGYVLSSFRHTDRDVAREILKCFVSPDSLRKHLNLDSLLIQLEPMSTVEQIKAVLDILVYQRLVRVVQGQLGSSYELTHDYLIPQIDHWISDEEREIRRILEVMEHERSICNNLRTLIPLERARFLKLHYAQQVKFSRADEELIEKSIMYGEEKENQVRNLERQLLQAQKMEAVGQLAGGIAHDFSNLIVTISGYTSLALSKVAGDQIGDLKQIFERVSETTDRASNLVRSLLAFARKGALDRGGIEQTTVNLPDIIDSLMELLTRVFPETIKIKTDLGDDIWPINGDIAQIEQVLLNLAVNARDAMPNGGMFEIAVDNLKSLNSALVEGATLPPGDFVMVSVTDTGIGMNRSVSSKIFEPFFTTKDVGKGTGLGLSIVYGIMKSLGGFVNVISELSKGTTFQIYFPKAQVLSSKESLEVDINQPLSGSEKILVVEDEAVLHEMIVATLSNLGYKIVSAYDGVEALEKYSRATDIDIVIMDMLMPKLSGPETAQRISKVNKNAKIILMSAYDVEHDKILWKQYCSHFLQKPFKMEELLRTIRIVLEH